MMMRNSPWFSESSPARVRNSPWFSWKFPCYGFKIPPGLLTLLVSLEPHVGCQMLEIVSETTQRHTHKRWTNTQLQQEEKELCKQACSLLLYSPPGQNSRLVWLSLLSIVHVHKCYRTAKGSEIQAYCRVCPEPFLPPYHRKGMFPRLQGTIKLKAVSRLLGRMPHLQARSARAESPVCRHVSTFPIVAVLTLHPTISSY